MGKGIDISLLSTLGKIGETRISQGILWQQEKVNWIQALRLCIMHQCSRIRPISHIFNRHWKQ